MNNQNQFTSKKNIERSQVRILLMFPLLFSFLFFTLLFFLIFKEITANTILIALLLIFAISIVFGKKTGLLSGFALVLIQLISSYIIYWLNNIVSLGSFVGIVTVSELLTLASLPVSGFLIGLYAETFGIYNSITERKVRDQTAVIQKLKKQVEQYEREWQSLSKTKIYHHVWDSLTDEDTLCEQLVCLIIESVNNQTQCDLLVQSLVSNQTSWKDKSDQILFDILVQNSPDILAILDLDGKILKYHDKLMAIYGIPISQRLENIDFVQILTPESAEKATRNLACILSTEYNPQEKYEIQSNNNKFSKLIIIPEVTITYSKNPLVLLASVSSSHVRINPEQMYQDLVIPTNLGELLQQSLCCVSANNFVTYLSPVICELIGENPLNVIGKKLDKYINSVSNTDFEKFMDICRMGQQITIELEMNTHNQKRSALRFVAFPASRDTGEYIGTTFLVEDITNVKKVEDILQHRLKIEKLISSISTRFVSVKAEDMDSEIERVLKIVSEFENTKGCSIEILPSPQNKKLLTYIFDSKQRTDNKKISDNNPVSNNYETISIPIILGFETVGYFKFTQEQYRDNWFDSDSKLICLIGEIIINALIRKENELNIKLNENRLRTTLHSIGDAVIATNPEGQIILMNLMAENLTGWNWDKAQNLPLNTVFNTIETQPDDVSQLNEVSNLHPLSETDGSIILTSQNGQQFFISVNRSHIEDHQRNFFGEVIVFRDVTQAKYENDEIRYISYHDKLTGLYNRTFFEEEIARLNTTRQYPITILLGDCNGLKIANDIFGHLEGDRLLQTIADIIKMSIRHEDIAARWGGDEFVIIMPQTDENVGMEIRERILTCCACSDHAPIQPSLAIGSATATEFDFDLTDVIKQAEDRMYRHKLMESKSNRNSLISSIEKMVFEKSYETEEHASRLKEISHKVGRAVGLSDYEQEELSILSVLHDIGKIGIPDRILQKSSSLSAEEWEIMKKHSEKGYNLAKATPELIKIAEAILHHHERWDGAGYPSGQKGEDIPKLSRILTIIDAYDVITHNRSYKQARSSNEALQEIEKCAGTQFDPELAKIFIGLMQEDGVIDSSPISNE